MAEATKKSPQSTGSGSAPGGGKAAGATDPNPERVNLGGASSSVTASGTGKAVTTGGSAGAGATSSTGSTSEHTSGTPGMSSNPSRGAGNGEAHGLIDQVKSSASDTFQTVKSNTTAKLEEQKSTLSSGLLTVADNIRQLGSNLSGGDQKDPFTRIAAGYSETAAAKLSSAADYLHLHDVETMYRDVEGFARRNPAVFVGGAFALGFLAARFLKSSAPSATNLGPSGSMTAGRHTNVPQLDSPRTTGAI